MDGMGAIFRPAFELATVDIQGGFAWRKASDVGADAMARVVRSGLHELNNLGRLSMARQRRVAIHKSNLPRLLRQIAEEMEWELGDCWEIDTCRMAADEIELLNQIIVHEPIELEIEEGDRANG